MSVFQCLHLKRDNVNVHRAAANIIVSKSRAARGSVCNVLLSRVSYYWIPVKPKIATDRMTDTTKVAIMARIEQKKYANRRAIETGAKKGVIKAGTNEIA